MALDSIGRIVVAGTSRNADNTMGHMLLLRHEASGALDGSFEGDGIVRTSDATDRGLDVAIDSSDHPSSWGCATRT